MKDVNEKQAGIHRALGHPVRLKMAKGLMKSECNVNNIVEKLKLPQSTVSQHLGILRNAGVIKGERNGVRICYKVVDEYVRAILRLS